MAPRKDKLIVKSMRAQFFVSVLELPAKGSFDYGLNKKHLEVKEIDFTYILPNTKIYKCVCLLRMATYNMKAANNRIFKCEHIPNLIFTRNRYFVSQFLFKSRG